MLNIVMIVISVAYIAGSVLICNLILKERSNGSLIQINGNIIGSKYIGQEFTNNSFFHSRPSLNHYKNNISGNSNQAYDSSDLQSTIISNHKRIKEVNNGTNNIDLNLISESASGLDPHITLNSAITQIPRIAKYSGIKEAELLNIVEKKAVPRIFGLFGEKLVNVLKLNLTLREQYGTKN